MILGNIENEFLMENTKLFFEYDKSHFISNAKSMLTNSIQKADLHIKINQYSAMIRKSLDSYIGLELNSDTLHRLLRSLNSNSESYFKQLSIADVLYTEIIEFKIQYMNQYIENVKKMIDDTINNNMSEFDIMRYVSGEFTSKVKKQIVRTNHLIECDLHMFNSLEVCPNIEPSYSYLHDIVDNYVCNHRKNKQKLVTEIDGVINDIKNAENDVKYLHKTIEYIKMSEELSNEKKQKLNFIEYNAIRSIIDIISLVSYLVIRKLTTESSKVYSCNMLCEDLMNIQRVNRAENNIITENADLFHMEVSFDQICDDLLNGRNTVLPSLAYNIYNRSAISLGITNTCDNWSDSNPSQIYRNIIDSILSIHDMITNITCSSDDCFIVIDELLEQSGLNIPIKERFSYIINLIDNISDDYNLPGVATSSIKKAMCELKEINNNINRIAFSIKEVYTSIHNTIYRINSLSTTHTDKESIRELLEFITKYREEYEKYVKTIGEKLFNRIRKLDLHILSTIEPEYFDNNVYLDVTEHTDFLSFAFESIINNINEYNDSYFKALETSYIIEKERVLRGVNLILEENQEEDKTTEDKSKNEKDEKSTDKNKEKKFFQVTDNNNLNGSTQTTNNSISKKISNLKADVLSLIGSIISKFKDITKKTNAKNAIWLANNKEGLINRSYANIQVAMLPYNNFPESTILSDINKIKNAINSITPQTLQNINSEVELYRKIFPMMRNLSDKEDFSKQIETYLKFGNNSDGSKTVNISNSNLKTFVVDSMIPYCEGYYGIAQPSEDSKNTNVQEGKFINSITSSLEELGKGVDNKIKSYGGTEITESVSVFTEENKNTESSITEKANWMRNAIKIFTGATFNALRDRAQYYIKGLSNLVPKQTKNQSSNNDSSEK